jgi:hypothetical protein
MIWRGSAGSVLALLSEQRKQLMGYRASCERSRRARVKRPQTLAEVAQLAALAERHSGNTGREDGERRQ